MTTRKSKLSEKPTRMPDIKQPKRIKAVQKYLEEIQNLKSESARSHRFTLLLQEFFGLQPNFIENYVSGIEKFVKIPQKDQVLKGRVDELFGNLVIEFEHSLNNPQLQKESMEQLRKYIAILWGHEEPDSRTPYIAMATDGVRFLVYTPRTTDPSKVSLKPDDVQLTLIDDFNLTALKNLDEFYFWLDRYFVRNEILTPTSENIVKDFGLKSHAFFESFQILSNIWESVKSEPEFDVIFDTWQKYLSVVYGSKQSSETLFLRHTYLATLAKLMVWIRFKDSESYPEDSQILEIIEGKFFKTQGIENFLEEDFLSWIARPKAREQGVKLARRLLSLLSKYHIRGLSEDVLKSLYQELVDPETRHDLGEYYTPDWLATRIIKKLLFDNPEASILDPSCGSGTFLYQAIHEKKRLLGNKQSTLQHILSSVVGADIHPLAVIIARANYVLALGDLLKMRKSSISIPVYLSNTLKLPHKKSPDLVTQYPTYHLAIGEKSIFIPADLHDHDGAIEACREYAEAWQNMEINENSFLNFLKTQHFHLKLDEITARGLFNVAKAFYDLIKQKRDTIWAFVLKNSYKPIFLLEKFDLVVGNPPWLSFRYIEQPEEQKFLKELIIGKSTKSVNQKSGKKEKKYEGGYALLQGRGELITHLELGTLFLLRSADLYLKPGGKIAFVLPRSIFTADQHNRLREGSFEKVKLKWTELWDLENVEPLFNVPACVLIGEKGNNSSEKADFSESGIAGEIIKGKLPRKNASLVEAEQHISVEPTTFYLHRRGKRSFWATGEATHYKEVSPYINKFYNGATIYPRPFWFVTIQSSALGFDPSKPPLITDERALKNAKDPYKGLVMKGQVEARFLYATLLSTDLLPFGHLPFRLVVLPIEPIEPTKDAYRIIRANEAKRRGFIHLARWLEKAQTEWEKRKGVKSENMDIYQRLNRNNGLIRQSIRAPYRVLYNASGTYLCAAVLDIREVSSVNGQNQLLFRGFIAECTTFTMESQSEEEAYFLSSILNSSVIDKLVKPLQSKGQFGPRHIHKKVLELPIPIFNHGNRYHQRLSELGEVSHKKVKDWIASGGHGNIRNIGVLRRRARQLLKNELEEIDKLVQEIIPKK